MNVSSGPDAPGPAPEGDGRRGWGTRRGRLLTGLVAALVVAGLVVVAVVLGARDGDGAGAEASTTPSPSATTPVPTTAAPTEAPTEQTPAAPPAVPEPVAPPVDDSQLPQALPAVALDDPVPVGEVTASLAVEAIQGQATGPGDVAGPALRVTVTMRNTTGADVPLDGVAVNAYYGDASTPAPPLNDPSRSEFTGLLSPGASADGVYVFRVPVEERGQVSVEVGYRPGAPLAIFSGAV